MKTRAITGLFFIVIMLASLFLGEQVFVWFYVALGGACMHEFYSLHREQVSATQRHLGFALGLLGLVLVATIFLSWLPAGFLSLVLLFPIIILLSQLFQPSTGRPFEQVSNVMAGWMYAGIPFACFLGLGMRPEELGAHIGGYSFSFVLPLGLLLLIWANDTGAYILGRAFGKHKLYERISPGKTWEGFVGGLVSTLVVSSVLFRQFETLSLTQWLAIAVIVSVMGTLGDLVESMLKRNLGIKDSGTILPGHGGFLDRFDSLLFAAPCVYLLLYLS